MISIVFNDDKRLQTFQCSYLGWKSNILSSNFLLRDLTFLKKRLMKKYSDKMVKVEPKQISLTDKLIETRNKKRTVNIVYRGALETTTWPEINKLADLYATVLIEQKMTLKTCAMIGQYSKEAFAQYVACILTGNTVLMLEPDFPDRFDILDDTETEIVIVDKKFLTGKSS